MALMRAHEALAAANQELEAFSYSVSHDLRAPLRKVDGFSQMLEDDYADKVDDTGRDYIHRIRAGSQRMGELIDDMLALSRVAQGDLQRTPVDLGQMAREVLDELRAAAPGRQVGSDIATDMEVDSDARLLRIALDNLLGNAWKYSSKVANARIEVGSQVRDGETVYYVRDNGAGFDASRAERVFQPFQRFHAAAEFEGTGIGLATVQRIVMRHGGRVWCESEVGRGSTFYFTLPSG
jgi:light-regulated signal transduction histidine kinase (bacteriophytochrome)